MATSKNLKSSRTVAAPGEVIRSRRLSKGWSVEKLAIESGLEEGTISDAEKSENVFIKTLAKIADALDLDLDLLLSNPQMALECANSANTAESAIEGIIIKLIVEVPRATFATFEEAERYVAKLKNKIGAKNAMILMSVTEGSTIFWIKMVAGDIRKLHDSFERGHLKNLLVTGITLAAAPSRRPSHSNSARYPNLSYFQRGALVAVSPHTNPALGYAADDARRLEARLQQAVTERMSYTTQEFGKIVGRSPFTVREWCRRGRIRAKKMLKAGSGAQFAISKAELLRYMQKGLLEPLKNPS